MSPLVREPQQQRSREKFARILSTAARLLETVPFDQLSTKQIAAEAGMSVGALYRFFPDKEAVLETLEHNWLEGDLRLLAAATDPAAVAACATSEQFIARVVEAYASRFRTLPGYRHVWFHVVKVPSLASLGDEVDRRIAERVHEVLVDSFGLADTAETRRRAHLAVVLATRMLGMAFLEDPQGDPEILADTPLMLDRYLFAPARTTTASD
ncbi:MULTISPECIES: TetR/AcrR family transcriptional regulator [unclassified Kitasatospora]|uniref:TetR/AcrR family transcriptional regulator n=1 Tax=unclassified Kitasatospora TaxID=2633591 RepID=UPI0037F1984E